MKLCVALDLDNKDSNLNLAREIRANFSSKDIWLKVGLNAFIRDGANFIKELQRLRFRIFLDLKIYDIPNTMLNALIEMQKLDIDMLTIHASSGFQAMQTLSHHINKTQSHIKIVAVSALTSFDNDEFMQIYNVSIQSCVRSFANLVYKAGLQGLVCSINEIEIIKSVSANLLAVTPGIRLDSKMHSNIESSIESKGLNDQKRTATPQVARMLGSDFIVVGRPIYNAKDRIQVIDSILRDCGD